MIQQIRPALWSVLVLIGLATNGCGDPAIPDSTDGDVESGADAESLFYEPSWDEQIAAVRDGRSTEIRLSAFVGRDQFVDLADGCESLTVLVLDHTELLDDDLDVLRPLPHLRWVKLTSPIGDAGD